MAERRDTPAIYLLAAMLLALAVQAWFSRPQEVALDYSDFKLLQAGTP